LSPQMLLKFLKHNFSDNTAVFCIPRRKRNRNIHLMYSPEISRHTISKSNGQTLYPLLQHQFQRQRETDPKNTGGSVKQPKPAHSRAFTCTVTPSAGLFVTALAIFHE